MPSKEGTFCASCSRTTQKRDVTHRKNSKQVRPQRLSNSLSNHIHHHWTPFRPPASSTSSSLFALYVIAPPVAKEFFRPHTLRYRTEVNFASHPGRWKSTKNIHRDASREKPPRVGMPQARRHCEKEGTVTHQTPCLCESCLCFVGDGKNGCVVHSA